MKGSVFMAKVCCVCGRNIGFMDGYKTLKATNEYVCERCDGLLSDYSGRIWSSSDVDEIDLIKLEADAFIESKKTDLAKSEKLHNLLEEKYNERLDFLNQQKAREVASTAQYGPSDPEPEPDLYAELCSQFMLITANNLEGYHITKQLGVVYGETVFKPSAGQQLVSAVGDMFRAFSFSAKEMSGQVSIIEEARKFAYVKMMQDAQERGANAIIAIDSDNTIGDAICYLSLYGTAVYVEPD